LKYGFKQKIEKQRDPESSVVISGIMFVEVCEQVWFSNVRNFLVINKHVPKQKKITTVTFCLISLYLLLRFKDLTLTMVCQFIPKKSPLLRVVPPVLAFATCVQSLLEICNKVTAVVLAEWLA
jgi:hypothetical protein